MIVDKHLTPLILVNSRVKPFNFHPQHWFVASFLPLQCWVSFFEFCVFFLTYLNNCWTIHLIKVIVKTVTPLFACAKNWSRFSAVKKIFVYYDHNWLFRTTKIICENKVKVYDHSHHGKIVQKIVSIFFVRTVYHARTWARTSAILLFSWKGLYNSINQSSFNVSTRHIRSSVLELV